MRVVLDTNVVLSAFLFGGKLQFIVELIIKNTLEPCFTSETWAELQRTLQYRHLIPALEAQSITQDEFLASMSVHAQFVANIASPVAVPNDPTDEKIVACALVAEAKAIVTGDKHLLALADNFSIPILTPQQFRQWFQKQ